MPSRELSVPLSEPTNQTKRAAVSARSHAALDPGAAAVGRRRGDERRAVKHPNADGAMAAFSACRAASDDLTPEDFRAVIDGGSALLAIVDERGAVLYGTPALAAELGYAAEDLRQMRAADLFEMSDSERAGSAVVPPLADVTPEPLDLRFRCRDGSVRVMRTSIVSCRDFRGRACVALSSAAMQEGVGHTSNQPVTSEDLRVGFPSRPAFMDRLARSIRRAQGRTDYTFAVLAIKIDSFDLISDTLGRVNRDRLLAKVGECLRDSVRPGDHVAFLDSGEFCVLVDRIDDPDDLTVIAGRIEKRLKRPFSLGAQEVAVSVGTGIAVSGETARSPYDLLKDAATAMHRAQALGPGRWEMFDQAMRARAAKRLKLVTDLRLAVARQQFTFYYQPILTLRTGAIRSFEALIRWQHPERGLLSPATFITAAEELGLDITISSGLLREACTQMREWHERFPRITPLSVSLNFTSSHFCKTGVVETVSEVLEQTGLDGSALTIEITESVLLHDAEAALATLEGLRRIKVQVHLDDFGTGFSSLSYLHQLPVDALKIDRSFVSRLGTDRTANVMIQTIIDLAHSLGKQVIAEGIETADQAKALETMGCDQGQGFYYAKPVESAEIPALLARCQGVLSEKRAS